MSLEKRVKLLLKIILGKLPNEKRIELVNITENGRNIQLKGKEGNLFQVFLQYGDFDKLSDKAFIGLFAHELAHIWSPDGSQNYKNYFKLGNVIKEKIRTPPFQLSLIENLDQNERELLDKTDIYLAEKEHNKIEEEADKLAISWGFEKELKIFRNEEKMHNIRALLIKI